MRQGPIEFNKEAYHSWVVRIDLPQRIQPIMGFEDKIKPDLNRFELWSVRLL